MGWSLALDGGVAGVVEAAGGSAGAVESDGAGDDVEADAGSGVDADVGAGELAVSVLDDVVVAALFGVLRVDLRDLLSCETLGCAAGTGVTSAVAGAAAGAGAGAACATRSGETSAVSLTAVSLTGDEFFASRTFEELAATGCTGTVVATWWFTSIAPANTMAMITAKAIGKDFTGSSL